MNEICAEVPIVEVKTPRERIQVQNIYIGIFLYFKAMEYVFC